MSMTSALLALNKEVKRTGGNLSQATGKFLGTETEVFKPDEFLRVSQIWYLCAREVVYRNLLPAPRPMETKSNMSMRLRMDTGTFLHSYFQNRVFGPMGVLWGTWKRKKKTWVGFQPKPDWGFVEETLEDKDLKLRGHTDGMISLTRLEEYLETGVRNTVIAGDPKDLDLVLLEIKSTDDAKFRTIKETEWGQGEDSYRMQATTYQHMKGVAMTLVFYVDRKYFAMLDFKYSGEDTIWEKVVQKVTSVWHGIATRELPPRCDACLSLASPKAKTCPYAPACFSSDPQEILRLAEAQ